jgi:hypothetical protein
VLTTDGVEQTDHQLLTEETVVASTTENVITETTGLTPKDTIRSTSTSQNSKMIIETKTSTNSRDKGARM